MASNQVPKIPDDEIPKVVDDLLKQINDEVILTLAERIKKVGKLSNEELRSINRLLDFYNEDMASINSKLATLTGKTLNEIETILVSSAEKAQIDLDAFYKEAYIEPIPYKDNKPLQNIVASALANIKGNILNISDTTVIGLIVNGKYTPFREAYNTIVDKAILSTITGAIDFQTTMRKTMIDLGRGVRVQYASGHTRRIDSAIRMNILDGVRSMNRDIRYNQGKEFGATGVYIMPHGLCAEDHLLYQGKEYTYKEFEELNNTLPRPIATGQWNCGHVAYDVVVGDSLLPYTEEELQKLNDYSTELVKWNGQSVTRYQASQKMREAETRIRQLKDKQDVFQKAGDTLNEERYKKYVKEATKEYRQRCKECGLKPRVDRLI